MRVELMPEIEPIDFSAIELERLTCKPDEAEVEQSLEQLAKVHGTTEPVATPRNAALGDVLLIDFKGTVDGEEFPGGAATSYLLELGSNSLIPGFEDQLVGAEAGTTVRVEVQFPETYGATELAGKDAVFEVDVREIRENKLAAIDDALAEKAGLESLDELRTAIRDDQERKLKSIQRMRIKRALLDHLAETARFEIPASMADQEFDQIWEHFKSQREEGQLDDDKDLAGKSDEEVGSDLRGIAERRVRLGLLLSEVGRLNDITVTQEDVNRAMASEAQRFPGRERAIFEYYQNSPDAADSLRAPIFEDKVVDFVLEMVTIKDREVTLAELINGPSDDAAGDEKKKKKPARTKKTRSKAKAG
jgi:trigger factor